MNKFYIALIVIMLPTFGFSQSKWYTTTGGEIIFSWANIDYVNSSGSTVHPNQAMRFSPVVNFQLLFNNDFTNHFGFFVGAGFRNVGFIWDQPDYVNEAGESRNARWKHRTYNLGIPIGIKIGRMNRALIFAGYEIEFPFNYKEKLFVGGEKIQVTVDWFSSKVQNVHHTLIAGLQFRGGLNVKFKYYFTNFFNTGYVDPAPSSVRFDGHSRINANVMFISLAFDVFRGKRLAYDYTYEE